MSVRETVLKHCGPGLLGGVTFDVWRRILRDEGHGIDPKYLPRVISITLQSLTNSLLIRRERRRFGTMVERVVLQPPLFVLGHWRSGTTLLHELLAKDPRFGFPNLCHVCAPHTFLCTEEQVERVMSRIISRQRPIDNMEWSTTSPQEDELGLCTATLKSPYMSSVFPQQAARFNKYLTFRDVPAAEREEWKRAFEHFLKKVQWRTGKPLVLKSPPHTARIRLLLEMFPQAKFVNIHRDPYRVFQSTRSMYLRAFPYQLLQKPNPELMDDWILRVYAEMYRAFFEEKQLIPPGHFHEVAFEDLERDPVGELRRLYDALRLPDFAVVEEPLRRYVASIAGFKKSELKELAPELKERIALEWRRSFDEWGYAVQPGTSGIRR